MDKVDKIDVKRRERYEKEKQYLVQLSSKKRPGLGLHLNLLSPTRVAPLRMVWSYSVFIEMHYESGSAR
jgi:hypothetical protein